MHTLGDININFNKDSIPNNFKNTKWNDLVSKFGLTQLINSPTRVTKTSSSIIDHIYTNMTEHISEIIVPFYSLSDHYPICFTRSVKCTRNCNVDHKSITYRCFKKFNEEYFQTDLLFSQINRVETINNPNTSLALLYDIINDVLSKHAPLKEKRIKHEIQPAWFTDEIKSAIFKRDKLHHDKKYDEYRILRNKITSMIKKSKKNFYNNAIKENKSPSFIWKNI